MKRKLRDLAADPIGDRIVGRRCDRGRCSNLLTDSVSMVAIKEDDGRRHLFCSIACASPAGIPTSSSEMENRSFRKNAICKRFGLNPEERYWQPRSKSKQKPTPVKECKP